MIVPLWTIQHEPLYSVKDDHDRRKWEKMTNVEIPSDIWMKFNRLISNLLCSETHFICAGDSSAWIIGGVIESTLIWSNSIDARLTVRTWPKRTFIHVQTCPCCPFISRRANARICYPSVFLRFSTVQFHRLVRSPGFPDKRNPFLWLLSGNFQHHTDHEGTIILCWSRQHNMS